MMVFFDENWVDNEEFVDEIFSENSEELINEFYVYPPDKQGKGKLKVLVRNKKDGAHDSKEMKHGPSIKVYNPDNGDYVPVKIEVKDGQLQVPSTVSDDNKAFIKSNKKVIVKLLNDHQDEIKEYWDSDSTDPKSKERMDQIESIMVNEYPFKKKK